MRNLFLALSIFILMQLSACSKENELSYLPDLSAIRANLAFTCVYQEDHFPPLNPEADVLFKYARYLEKKAGPKDHEDIGRYYRIAAAYGHYKANNNLQAKLQSAELSSPDRVKEAVGLATTLVDQGIGLGYYNIGLYLKSGFGFKQNEEEALRYFRKAADLGVPDAQYYVGDLLAPSNMAPKIAQQMWSCAAKQGHGRAGLVLGVDLKGDGLYREATEAFQLGAAAGEGTSAMVLRETFGGIKPENELYYLALSYDPERVRRYELIGKFLSDNQYRNPKVPDIDKIVPLPPAKLPEWDGTFQWAKDNATPPEKPSDELVNRLAKEKNLDPSTGLPIPQPLKVSLGTRAKTNEFCPESGVWQAHYSWYTACPGDSLRQFKKGETFPTHVFYSRRDFAVLNWILGPERVELAVLWRLTAYEDEGQA